MACTDDYGRDVGGDIPQATEYTHALRPLLDRFGNDPRLRLVLYTLDETAFSRELAPLAGGYPAVYLGAPWWFLDTPDGLRRFREAVTDTAGFANTAGFVDDTRAFCSIPVRHEVARRVDAGLPGPAGGRGPAAARRGRRDDRRPRLPPAQAGLPTGELRCPPRSPASTSTTSASRPRPPATARTPSTGATTRRPTSSCAPTRASPAPGSPSPTGAATRSPARPSGRSPTTWSAAPSRSIFADPVAFSRSLTADVQLRWLGPEKGVIHMAAGALVNAVWDLRARLAGKPMWRLLAELPAEELVASVDFHHISDALTPAEALRAAGEGRAGLRRPARAARAGRVPGLHHLGRLARLPGRQGARADPGRRSPTAGAR